jgi:hypothetical protein
MSRYLPRIERPSGNGGGGGGGEDRFAPRYIVGNVPAGDSPDPYNAGGFQYIPDTGNGAGIEGALSAASFNNDGDVYIRRGTYDWNLAGSPASPIPIPAAATVRGAGNLTDLRPRTTVLGPATIFTLGASSRLMDVRINCIGETEATTGVALIEVLAGITAPALIERVDFQYDRGDNTPGSSWGAIQVTAGQLRISSSRMFLRNAGGIRMFGNIGSSQATVLYAEEVVVRRAGGGLFREAFELRNARGTLVNCEVHGSFAQHAVTSYIGGGFQVGPPLAIHGGYYESQGQGAVALIRPGPLSRFLIEGAELIVPTTATATITSNAQSGRIVACDVGGVIDTSVGARHIVTSNIIRSPVGSNLHAATDEVAHNIYV